MVAKNQKTERASENVNFGNPTQTYEQVISATKLQLEEAVKAGTAMAEKVMGLGKDRLEAVAKTCEELSRVNQRGLSAIVAAGNAAVEGAGALNTELLAFAKANVDSNLGQVKALANAKTLKDLVELQSEFVRSAFDIYVKAGSKFGELSGQVAQATFAPIGAELRSGVSRLSKAAA